MNLAESGDSINFDISDSKAGFASLKQRQLNQSSSKNLHDGSESMDQHDFDLSQSEFSMSKGFGLDKGLRNKAIV